MKIRRGAALRTILVATLMSTLFGCGSTNNDQGVSFLLQGFATASKDGCTGTDNLENGQSVALSEAAEGAGSDLRAAVVARNQTVTPLRIDRVLLSYYAPGSSINIPSTSVPLGITLGAAGSSPNVVGTVGGSSGGASGLPTCVSATVPILPAAVRAFINLNRSSFPELPFDVEVSAVVSGVTSSGSRIETNDATYFIKFLPDVVINPPASGGSSATG